MCPQWSSLPPGMSYLDASVYDLEDMTTAFGNKYADPPKTVHGLVRHCPGGAVATCRCQTRPRKEGLRKVSKSRHNPVPVQVFFPRYRHQFLQLK